MSAKNKLLADADKALAGIDYAMDWRNPMASAVLFATGLADARQFVIDARNALTAPAAVPGPLEGEGELLKAIYLAAVRFVGHAKRVKFADGKEITGMTDLDNAMKAYEAHYAMARTAAPAGERKG